jgi:hypothetical protein
MLPDLVKRVANFEIRCGPPAGSLDGFPGDNAGFCCGVFPYIRKMKSTRIMSASGLLLEASI